MYSCRPHLAAGLLLLVCIGPALAWVYPEHRDIAMLAVESLDAQRQAQLDRLWSEARTGHEQRLCASAADARQGVAPACIDWAAFSAIAGDHSCSSKEMLNSAVKSDWILAVADVSAQLKVDLTGIEVTAPLAQQEAAKGMVIDLQRTIEAETVRARRLNALRTADTRLQRADPEYATRAGSNNAHFLVPRPRTDFSPREYGELTLRPGADLNAIGVYTWFHLSALQKASRLATESLAPTERQDLARAMLADEGFALHFLQDTFAAGHVAGAWGDASQRKGTHDYYNEAGLEVFLWRGSSESTVLMGDAHMRKQDAERAAASIRASLEQVIDQASGRAGAAALAPVHAAPAAPDDFNVCKNKRFEARAEGLRATPEIITMVTDILGPTPVPGLGPGLGAMPRFRAELGTFIGLTGSIDARGIGGGFVDSQTKNGWVGGGELALRFGLGLDGVIGESSDGLVFASIGVRGDSASTTKFSDGSLAEQAGSLTAAIPSRMSPSARLRMPFFLIPGDLLLLAPMFFISPETYTNMAVTASNGGVIPWQTGWSTSIGRFQFVLGREIGATRFGRSTLIAPASAPGSTPTLVDFKSTFYDLPIAEFRPYRAFDTRQSSALLVQLFAGADVPYGATVVSPAGGVAPQLKTAYSIGLRLVFDWRRYY